MSGAVLGLIFTSGLCPALGASLSALLAQIVTTRNADRLSSLDKLLPETALDAGPTGASCRAMLPETLEIPLHERLEKVKSIHDLAHGDPTG